MPVLPTRLGVVGAGTMGAGIAQLGCLAGFETLLHDPVGEALEQGAAGVREGLLKGAARGRWTDAQAEAAGGRLKACPSLEDLGPSELVIEAVPERIELKRELFARLSESCGADTILATNTSSIPVTSLATAAERPENVVGMHFFNPAPLMRLLEVVRGEDTGARALEVARAVGEAMNKHVIVATDGPGFLVNRCGRPFGAEALRLLQERVADVAAIDRICRLGGGFRMGPFELMDLVGVDVGYEVARSFHELSFGEPRWKPSPIQARMAAAGRHGRKTGRGYYDYRDGPHRADDPDPPAAGGGGGRIVAIDGFGSLAAGLRERARGAGFDVREPFELGTEEPELLVDASVPAPAADLATGELGLMSEGPALAAVCADRSLAARGDPEACGFYLAGPDARLVELTHLATTPESVVATTESFFTSLGLQVEWVADAPGLVLGRIVCQLVNEAAFAVGEGVGAAADVDAGLTLGLNHPRGPLDWGRQLGRDHVLAVIDGLWGERHDERYRAAPALRRAVQTGAALE